MLRLVVYCWGVMQWRLQPKPPCPSVLPQCPTVLKSSGYYLLTSSIKPANHYSKIPLHTCVLKFEQLVLTRGDTVGTLRCTVISLVIENAMALRPKPPCPSVLPQCPTVLKSSGYYLLTSSIKPANHYSKIPLHTCVLKFEQLVLTRRDTVGTLSCTVISLVIENAMALRPKPPCPSVYSKFSF